MGADEPIFAPAGPRSLESIVVDKALVIKIKTYTLSSSRNPSFFLYRLRLPLLLSSLRR